MSRKPKDQSRKMSYNASTSKYLSDVTRALGDTLTK